MGALSSVRVDPVGHPIELLLLAVHYGSDACAPK